MPVQRLKDTAALALVERGNTVRSKNDLVGVINRILKTNRLCSRPSGAPCPVCRITPIGQPTGGTSIYERIQTKLKERGNLTHLEFLTQEVLRRGTTQEWCMKWPWPLTKDGYGVIRNEYGVMEGIHRISYRILFESIPEGLEIDHLCRNKSCFNPRHLEAVTKHENISRAWLGKQRGETVLGNRMKTKTHCPRGHIYNQENTYQNPRGFRQCLACERIRTAKRKIERQKSKISGDGDGSSTSI